MIKKSTMLLLIPILFLGCQSQSSREKDVPLTMKYIDEGQVPVPPEALSPYEPKEVTYVDEPSVELDDDWNLDVKLFSKFRYTKKFQERWQAKMGYTPRRPVITDKEFFEAIDLNYPGLEKVKAAVASGDFTTARDEYLSYQASRTRAKDIESIIISKESGEEAAKEADEIIARSKFPDVIPLRGYSLFRPLGNMQRAYLYTKNIKYAQAWVEMFDYWYKTYRPPANRLKTYIGFIFARYWATLSAGDHLEFLCDNERWLAHAQNLGLDKDKIFSVYKSILEHAQFLYQNNDVFMPGNWQVHQFHALVKTGVYYPSFQQARLWCEHAWKLIQEHMANETYADGTHSEVGLGYEIGTVEANRLIVQYVRRLGWDIPEAFLRKWRLMYLLGTKIIPPTGSMVPEGDGSGIGPDGYVVKRLLIPGVLEFDDPTMKYFAEQYPDDVKKTAEERFDNTDEVLAAYNKVKAKRPSFKSILLPDAAWAVMRYSWDKKSPYLFFDGGWDEAWHSHPDFGNFNIWAYGRPLVTECGRSGPYEADISKRWGKQTISHNTVMVDRRSMRRCVNNRITQWWTGPGYDFVDAWSDGYRWIGVLHNRRVLFVKPDYWIISDFLPGPVYWHSSFQTTGYHEFDWLAHFQPTTLKINEKTKRIDTTNKDANIVLVPLNYNDIKVKESKGPTGTSGAMVDAPYISLHQERMAFVQYQVLLMPYEGTKAPKVEFTKIVADKADRVHRQNIGYEIKVLGRKDIFLESGNSKEDISFGDYKLRGAVAHIRDAGKSNPTYLLLDADRLLKNSKLLFSAPISIKAFEFAISEQDDSMLEITTQSKVSGVKINAPKVKKVKVNNKKHTFTKAGEYIIL